MDVLEAIESRKSIRAFTDQSVPLDVVKQLIELSQRAPSGTNTQPWHVHICTGDVRQAITDDVLALAGKGDAKTYEHYNYYPDSWLDIHRDRRRGVGWGLYGLLGIKKGDREAAARRAQEISSSSMRQLDYLLPRTLIWRWGVGPIPACTSRPLCLPRAASDCIPVRKPPGSSFKNPSLNI